MAQIGPTLPPGWKPPTWDDAEDESEEIPADKEPRAGDGSEQVVSDDCYGPVLPPDMIQESPAVSQEKDESDEDSPVGPVPELEETAEAYAYRLYKLRREKEEEEEIRQRKRAREEWMTELPSKLSKSYGLTARTFKKHGSNSCADSSAWTETPDERRRKGDKAEDGKSKDEKALFHKAAADRDHKFDAEVERLNEKRAKESLVDLHNRKRKKEKEEAEKSAKTERRPFDREKDLKIMKLQSEPDKRSTLDKVHQLGTRFGHGGDQKYL